MLTTVRKVVRFFFPPAKKRRVFTRLDLAFVIFLLVVVLISMISAAFSGTQGTYSDTGRGGVQAPIIPADVQPPGDYSQFYNSGRVCVDGDGGSGCVTNAGGENDPVLKHLAATIPEQVLNTQIHALWQLMLVIVDSILVLAIMVNGYRIMAGSIGFKYATAIEAFPRILMAAIGAHISLSFVGMWIGINNGLCGLVYEWIKTNSVGIPEYNVYSLNGLITGALKWVYNETIGKISIDMGWAGSIDVPDLDYADDEAKNLMSAIFGLVTLIMGVILIIQAMARVGLIVLMTVISPIGMGVWALPQGMGQQMFKFWMTATVMTIIVQFLQLIVYGGGTIIFSNISGDDFWGIPMKDVIRLVALWLAMRIPGFMQNPITGTMSAASQTALSGINQGMMMASNLFSGKK